ncbi:tRNA (guanosine(46)-N7)-methyltransferase TrmB [Sphingobacterium sp. DK4209]|uniref:tRNA (guanine-N(7)-)-methyltransferase n=1 Tax=Sphingobacterium zhuxiongii TaxID=2662364 RepID=A0A5Q0QCZ1_9SPHI|nr:MULTISPECIES: tRNA (guanosine(46)-N7)-methyltransferase TrmB [unclassified Sphingobacterium]MVZ66287.1 tRNA (guanosine(46)-N7)-methyltransferase TrmB [Sphingobacterium sp. DK4209]QGA25070.1 tRNA (guanosine(46)-N7)-methyltransferase TrmB [Sphingobacterium sp. dk4302]
MGKDKLRKFAEVATFLNVVQLDEGKPYKGKWASEFFKNEKPLILELACGKGEYTVNLAKLFPEKNFIGIDYKGNRIWRGAKTALEDGITNVGFLRIQIETILEYFEKGEISEIWITFPDPQPQDSREKKRLTNPVFLERYKHILIPQGIMHLKTDNDGFYAYTLEQIELQNLPKNKETTDLYQSDLVDEVLSIKTYYEKKYLAVDKNINYVQWRFNKEGE